MVKMMWWDGQTDNDQSEMTNEEANVDNMPIEANDEWQYY